jgi:4'-phosphopantetheinyl transferase
VSGHREIELWCVDLSAAKAALLDVEARSPRLADDQLERAAAISDLNVRTEWQAAHIALRILLERACGSDLRRVAFAREERGRPYLVGSPSSFSLSHAPGIALIGVAPDGVIGVDIERTRPVRIAAARRDRIRAAGAAISSPSLPAAPDTSFLQAWVRLEALAKAEGCGIGRLLTRLGIMGSAAAAEQRSGPDMQARATAILAASPVARVNDLQLGHGLFAAVALSSTAAPPPVNWLPADAVELEKLAS